MRILITGGGTREPIDGVRSITNFSTGATAARIADAFDESGDEVTCLIADTAVAPRRDGCRVERFVTFADLDSGLRTLLARERFDAVIHLAAVSDYSIASIESDGATLAPGSSGKLDSRGDLVLRLKRNFKIVERLRSYSGSRAMALVAFKLTHSATASARSEAVSRLASQPDIDFVVHNDLADRLAGAPHFTLHSRDGESMAVDESYSTPEKLALGLRERILHHDSRA